MCSDRYRMYNTSHKESTEREIYEHKEIVRHNIEKLRQSYRVSQKRSEPIITSRSARKWNIVAMRDRLVYGQASLKHPANDSTWFRKHRNLSKRIKKRAPQPSNRSAQLPMHVYTCALHTFTLVNPFRSGIAMTFSKVRKFSNTPRSRGLAKVWHEQSALQLGAR